jgi:hypothetical protein
VRVADLLSDFRGIQYRIASISSSPPHPNDYHTEGYAALRQCALDGQHILNVAADTRVPRARGGPAEQEKAELTQVILDGFSRRHEAQKIWLRQSAVLRWVGWREAVLMGMRPDARHASALAACDVALRAVSVPVEGGGDVCADAEGQELATITDEDIYNSMRASDYNVGRWTDEDPSLRHVQRWLRSRR